MNNGIQVSFSILISSRYMTRSGTAGSYGGFIPNFLRNLHTIYFFQVFNHSSVQFSRSVMCDSLQPHELQHARPPCPSPTPRVHSDSRPSSGPFLEVSSQNLLITGHFPDPYQPPLSPSLSFFRTVLISGTGFSPTLFCVSLLYYVYIIPLYFVYSHFPTQTTMLSASKRYILINISQVILLLHTHAKCTVTKESG